MGFWFEAAGPMIGKELLELARRRSYWFLRITFALGLLALLWSAWSMHEGQKGLRVLANIASMTFTEIAIAQYVAIHLLAPIVLCGCVADERKAGTLDLLFTTELTDREIVIGKLASRIFVVVVIVVSGLPALALMTFWGGFTPTMVFGLEIGTIAAALFTSSLAIFYSVTCATSLRALVYTYLVLFGLFASTLYLVASPTFVLILVFAGGTVVPLEGWIFVYAGVCVLGWLAVAWALVRRASARLRVPLATIGRESLKALDRALESTPITNADDTIDRQELRRVQRQILREIGDVESKAGRFDFSDRPEVGCVAVVFFNMAAMALPLFMTGVLVEPQLWLSLLLAGAALVVAWIASQSLYLDRKGGFRDVILATPLEGDEILRLVLRRWRTSLFWPMLCVGVGQALWLVFDLKSACVLLGTESLLAANLVGLCLACTVASQSRMQSFFACLLAGSMLMAAGRVAETLVALRPEGLGIGCAFLLACAVGYVVTRGAVHRAAFRFVANYALCMAAFLVPAAWLSGSLSTRWRIADWLNAVDPIAILASAFPQRLNAQSGQLSIGDVQFGGEIQWLKVVALWLGLVMNLWVNWRWLVAAFDRFVDRPREETRHFKPPHAAGQFDVRMIQA